MLARGNGSSLSHFADPIRVESFWQIAAMTFFSSTSVPLALTSRLARVNHDSDSYGGLKAKWLQLPSIVYYKNVTNQQQRLANPSTALAALTLS